MVGFLTNPIIPLPVIAVTGLFILTLCWHVIHWRRRAKIAEDKLMRIHTAYSEKEST